MKHLLLATLLCFGAAAAENEDSVLGLEPGTRQLCNDDLGVILWGPDHAPTLSVGKSDVWDRRLPAPPEPVLTLDQMIAGAHAGDPKVVKGAAYYTAYNSHDFPCPKPLGQLILQLPFLGNDGTLEVKDEPHAWRLHAAAGEKQLDLRIFVSALHNLIVLEGDAKGLATGDFGIRFQRHRDTILPGGELHPTLGAKNSPLDFEQLPMPRAGGANGVAWIAQDFPPELTFPQGFTAVLAGRFAHLDGEVEVVEGKTALGTPMVAPQEGRLDHGTTKRFTPINEAQGSAATLTADLPEGPFLFLATGVTTQDDPNPVEYAACLLAEAAGSGAGALRQEHEQQLTAYEARPHARAWSKDGSLNIDQPWGGVPYAVRPAGFYGDVPLCSVASTKFCFQDSSGWHGDFHFNEVDATGPCMLRQFDTLDSYYRMILNLLPMAQANARQVYGCAGAMYPLVHYPLRAESVIHTHMTWEQSMEITALLVRPFWLRFQYTGDMDFLRDLAYPVVREGARFYAEYLKREDDGLYHVYPTVSPEHRGITQNLEFNRDSQSGITLIRYHLRAAAQAAALLGVDLEEAARWRGIAEHMPPYPVVKTSEGPIFIDVAGAEPIEYNIPVPLSAVFWGDDIGLDSPPEQLEIARRTLRLINVWVPHRGYLGGVKARLGLYEPGDVLGAAHLLQSHTGVMRVFPAVPAGFEGGFENLGAQGAFVVSSTHDAAGVSSVEITSLAGNPCVLANPWPGAAAVQVQTDAEPPVRVALEGDKIFFGTARDKKYRVTPGGQ